MNFNIDGIPNKLYSNGMVPADFWESLKKRFDTKDAELKETYFYSDNRFALWIEELIQTTISMEGDYF